MGRSQTVVTRDERSLEQVESALVTELIVVIALHVAGDQGGRWLSIRPHMLQLAGQGAQVYAIEGGDIDLDELGVGDQGATYVARIRYVDAMTKSHLLEASEVRGDGLQIACLTG